MADWKIIIALFYSAQIAWNNSLRILPAYYPGAFLLQEKAAPKETKQEKMKKKEI